MIIEKLSKITLNIKKANRPFNYKLRVPALIILFFVFPLVCPAEGLKKLCLKDICIQVEIVDSAEGRQQGLMFRKQLGEGQGMLFILGEERIASFWMKNMQFALDIIWIDKDRRIAGITDDAQACNDSCPSLNSPKKVKYVLEVNSGFAKKNQLQVGDKIDF